MNVALLTTALAGALLAVTAQHWVSRRASERAGLEYQALDEAFYDQQTDPRKVSAFRAWYHRSRFDRLEVLLDEICPPDARIADLGCGNCWWNRAGRPVTGLDVNRGMLEWAQRNGRLNAFEVCDDLARTPLPDAAFDVVVMSEVLEHLPDHDAVLTEVRRLLREDGTFVVTVPYDFFLGPFFWLFNLNCLYLGYVRGSSYHRHRCGHIHHFTRRRLARTLERGGFRVDRLFVVNGLLLYATARKSTRPGG